MTRAWIVYLIGVMALGLGYYPLKAATGGRWLFVGVAVIYLVILRLLGYAWERRAKHRREDSGDPEG